MKAIKKSFENDGLNMSKLVMLSRDDPKVMGKVQRELEGEARKLGNPALIEGPCYIHPCHTALKKGQDKKFSRIAIS